MKILNRLLRREPHKGKWNHSSFHTHRYTHAAYTPHFLMKSSPAVNSDWSQNMRLSLIKTFTHKIRRLKNYGISKETKNLKEENQAEKFEANSFCWNRRNSGNNISCFLNIRIYIFSETRANGTTGKYGRVIVKCFKSPYFLKELNKGSGEQERH